MIVGVLTTCHTQYTWDRSICLFLFNRTTLQVFVTYLTGALYVHHLWFYKHQHDNRVRSKLFVACQRWWFEWRFWFVPSVPGYLREEEEHKPDPWRNSIERNHMGLHLENAMAVVKTPTIISNNPVYSNIYKASLTAWLVGKKFALQVADVPGNFYTAITLDWSLLRGNTRLDKSFVSSPNSRSARRDLIDGVRSHPMTKCSVPVSPVLISWAS